MLHSFIKQKHLFILLIDMNMKKMFQMEINSSVSCLNRRPGLNKVDRFNTCTRLPIELLGSLDYN